MCVCVYLNCYVVDNNDIAGSPVVAVSNATIFLLPHCVPLWGGGGGGRGQTKTPAKLCNQVLSIAVTAK